MSYRNNKIATLLGLSVMMGMLAGCEDADLSSLQAQVQQIKNDTPTSVPPLPEVKPYEPFTYSASDMRSPFARLDPEFESRLLQIDADCVSDVKPDPNRRKDELEKYGLDALQYVGLISNNKEHRGLVKILSGDSAGVIQPVHEGEYLGLDDGRITKIDSNQITIEAIVPNGRGCWEARTQYLVLGQ
ncbi:pilus assembly protein PilP [Kangiella aquimarina]|uniref:Pilus assembly protein PilP n=1 Tax=Kangiella aquimarina TaxID=261965 RepID=A0ABZ0X6I2_9GAMM|nr:pilus assembly protein PilP [Kangiella aquimarina]WQG86006.1 pilus assembly protein PilP [Kangiella aquimarina]